jgi:hypothetical protein
MTPRSKFVIVPPRKTALAAKRSTPKPPSFSAIHKTLGECRVVGVRLGDSGAWLADVVFGQARRTLQLTQDHWLTPVSEIVPLAAYFPQTKPMVKKAKASDAPDEGGEESELGAEANEDDGNDSEQVNDLEAV